MSMVGRVAKDRMDDLHWEVVNSRHLGRLFVGGGGSVGHWQLYIKDSSPAKICTWRTVICARKVWRSYKLLE